MQASINEHDLKLLAYLHDHAKGYGTGFRFNREAVGQEIGLIPEDMSKATSYLTEWGLIGSRTSHRRSDGVMVYREVYLSALGENYMRELENAPSVAQKLTVGVVSELWKMGKGAIVGAAAHLFAEFTTHSRH